MRFDTGERGAEMSDLRAAAQQALEALKSSTPKPRNEDDDYAEKGWKEHYAAITALRAALAEPVQEPVAWGVFEGENLHDFYTLREDAAQMAGYKGAHAVVAPLYTPPTPAQAADG